MTRLYLLHKVADESIEHSQNIVLGMPVCVYTEERLPVHFDTGMRRVAPNSPRGFKELGVRVRLKQPPPAVIHLYREHVDAPLPLGAIKDFERRLLVKSRGRTGVTPGLHGV